MPRSDARKAVTRRPMPISLHIFHWCMMICTAGLWTPVYLASRRKRRQVTTFR